MRNHFDLIRARAAACVCLLNILLFCCLLLFDQSFRFWFVQLTDAANIYYVGANGNDSNNGTSKTTPWLHVPGCRLQRE